MAAEHLDWDVWFVLSQVRLEADERILVGVCSLESTIIA
jgi:hypothetical protein